MTKFSGLYIIFLAPFFVFLSCNSGEGHKNNVKDTYVDIGNQNLYERKKEFPMINIPTIINSSEERVTYLITHYWDKFDFSDTTHIHLPEVTMLAFVDYLNLLFEVEHQQMKKSVFAMLEKSILQDISQKMYPYFLSLYKGYLYDPNSLLRDEECYLIVTEFILSDSVSGTATKEQARFDREMMLKNRKGNIAVDFNYLTSKGAKGRLYDINKKFILLYFHNPGCDSCFETVTKLRSSILINNLLENNQLEILAVYPDEDISLWKAHLGKIPNSWINACDDKQLINKKQLYDLKAIPTLYLLDKNKKVLLKDATFIEIESYFGIRK